MFRAQGGKVLGARLGFLSLSRSWLRNYGVETAQVKGFLRAASLGVLLGFAAGRVWVLDLWTFSGLLREVPRVCIYVYIYIYICVCVYLCVCMYVCM